MDSAHGILPSTCSSACSGHADGDSSKPHCWCGGLSLDSKNWENGSNEYVTDATKQAVSIERRGKGFHLRVTRPRVRSAVG